MPGHLVCQTPRRTPLGGSREPQAVGAAQKEFLANGWPTQGRRKADVTKCNPGVCGMYTCIGADIWPTRRRRRRSDVGPTRGRQPKKKTYMYGMSSYRYKHKYIYIYTNKRDIDIRRIYVSTPPCYRSACSPAAAFVSSPLSPQRSTCLKPAHLIQTLRNVFCETQFCNYE